MTDFIVKDGDRVFVFGNTSMFEYGFVKDNKGNEQLELYKIWQGKHASEVDRDRVRADMKATNQKTGGRPR